MSQLTLVDVRQRPKITGIGYYGSNLLTSMARIAPDEVRPICLWHQRREIVRLGLRPFTQPPARVRWERPMPPADVIHGLNFHALPHPDAVRVATIHDVSYMRLPECHPPGMPERLDAIVRRTAPLTRLFLCVSENTREDFIEVYGVEPERTRVIHNGVSERFFERVAEDVVDATLDRLGVPRPYLLHVGAMVPRKDLGTLMETFSLVLRERGDMNLVLAGNKTLRWASDWPRVEAWLHRNPEFAAQVKVLDYVREEDVYPLYQGAAASVSTTLLEGFGLTVLEGLASGVPVISSRAGAVPEIGGDMIRYGEPRKPETYADAVLDTLVDADSERRIQEGLDWARTFTWERAAAATLQAYRDAAA